MRVEVTDRHTSAPTVGDCPAGTVQLTKETQKNRQTQTRSPVHCRRKEKLVGRRPHKMISRRFGFGGHCHWARHNDMRTRGWRSTGGEHVRIPAINGLQREPASRGSSVEQEAASRTTDLWVPFRRG